MIVKRFSPLKLNAKHEFRISLAFCGAIAFFALTGIVAFLNVGVLQHNSQEVGHTHEVILDLDDLLSIMKDAETGQRGYLITGDERYLQPYTAAVTRIDARLDDLNRLTRESPIENALIPSIKKHIQVKFDELAETIDLRRREGFDAARAVVLTDRGKTEMDILRLQISQIQAEEEEQRLQRIASMADAYHMASMSGVVTCLFGMLLAAFVAYLVRRAAVTRQREEWLQAGQMGLAASVLGELRVSQLAENVLKQLSEFLVAPVAAFFVKEGETFNRVATYGVPSESRTIESFTLGAGLLGQAVKDRRTFIVHDVPEGYLSFGSALGQSKPNHLLIVPVVAEGFVNSVLEFGFIHPPESVVEQFIGEVSELIAVAVRSANYRAYLQTLLEETQRQSEELQTQSEELRVSNEELEEQSRSLKQSQAHLEQQQTELEQINSQLEEQAQLLETQRDDLTTSKAAVQLKAKELELASQYKSDFLANMSHELRTPLNSSLILAKLLADNPKKNLTDEQVKFAQTIQSSGNDLLILINDILDLSKIEGGHMEIHPETVLFESMVKQLKQMFDPLAKQKGLELRVKISQSCPSTVETDPLRLQQILKNLLSNSIKFTEKGSVELAVAPAADNRIAFAVADTGIGIAQEHFQAVFEAFRQADGTINRKYGGTGLGLSISRELARLLGGEISLSSKPGEGSTFTVTIPQAYAPPVLDQSEGQPVSKVPMPAMPHLETAKMSSETERQKLTRTRSRFDDDREQLDRNRRLILVVEDDATFARILYDMTHEKDFQCLLADNAEDALNVAAEFVPSAILLDVGLPDHSGLSVLDRLKRDPRTRHIPVHVISGSDYSQTAMSLGAVGYMMKPVKREQVADVLQELEQHLERGVKRVLVVEDNATQRDSIMKLVGSETVETVGVGTVGECLEQLKSTTFDCMVLDLSLPDASGYSLLETLSKEDAYSFPPVIVYTGRDLSSNEEQSLRRYSNAIIIKGAKSPERLLDEVTLFLHQVVANLPTEQQQMIESVRNRDTFLEGRCILAVEDDVRNVYALTSIFEPLGVVVQIARNGREALEMLNVSMAHKGTAIDLVLMDVMMPEMDGLTATREIRKKAEWKKLPIIMLTAKAMKDDQEKCLEAGANDYIAKPLDVEKLLSLVRVWMPR